MANLGNISTKNPQVYYLTDPQGLDKEIQSIQSAIADNLSWIEKSFGRGFKIAEQDKPGILPYAYMGGTEKPNQNDYYQLTPNDNLKSYSFFFANGQSELIDYQQFSKSNLFTRPISLIVWGNLKRIAPNDEYQIEQLQNEVFQLLKTNVGVTAVTEIIDENINNIFSPFSLDEFKRQLFYPYFAFRVNFTLVWQERPCSTNLVKQKPFEAYSAQEIFDNIDEATKIELFNLIDQTGLVL